MAAVPITVPSVGESISEGIVSRWLKADGATVQAGEPLLELETDKATNVIPAAFRHGARKLLYVACSCCYPKAASQPLKVESLGAGPLKTFRYIVFPNLLPAILSGVALAFARAVGEFGSIVLISGNLPFKTEVASVFIFGRIESGDPAGAAAVSVVILAISFAMLLGIGALRRWTTRHDRV